MPIATQEDSIVKNSVDTLPQEVRGTLVYVTAAPILAVWTLVSALPLFNAAGAWGAPLQVLTHLTFLGGGALGLLGGLAVLKWVAAAPETAGWKQWQPDSDRTRLTRVVLITAYALAWMTAYAFFVVATL
jgi:hypothetical protein